MTQADFTSLATTMTTTIGYAIVSGLVVWGTIAGISASKAVFAKLAGR